MATSKELKCFTADPELITLYGISYGYSNLPSTPSSDPNMMVLFRSRMNPKSLNDTQWPIVVATIPINTTVASVITRKNSVIGGKGDWSTIDEASDYNLTEFPIHNGHKLFYTVEDGKETLLHAYASVVHPNNATVIRLGHISDAGDRPLLEHSTTYKSDTLRTNVVSTIAYGNNQLYAYAPGPDPDLFAIPLINRTSSSKPTIKRYNAKSTTDCQFPLYDGHMSATWKDSFFLLCYNNGAGVADSFLLETINSTLKDNKTTTLSKLSTDANLGTLTYLFFQPIGGNLPYQPAFAVLNGVLGIQGITLTGPSAGKSQGHVNVWIGLPWMTDGPDRSSSSEQLSVGA